MDVTTIRSMCNVMVGNDILTSGFNVPMECEFIVRCNGIANINNISSSINNTNVMFKYAFDMQHPHTTTENNHFADNKIRQKN